MQDLVAWELANGFEVHIAVGNDSDVNTATFSGASIHHVKPLVKPISPLTDVDAVVSLRNLSKFLAISVMHTHQAKAGIVGRSAVVGRPVQVAHWVHGPSFGAGFSSLGSLVYRTCERLADSATTVWVFVGDELRSRYVSAGICKTTKTVVVRSPIEVDRYLALRNYPDAARAQARSALRLGSDLPIVVNVGAMEWRKRQNLFLEAVSLMPSKPLAVLAGDGPERTSLERQAGALEIAQNTRFLGYLQDLGGLFSIASVLVHTSAREGAPQVVLQALAAGIPVVATPACGLREVGQANVDIVPANPRALAAAVQGAIRHSGTPPDPSAFQPWSLSSRQSAYDGLYDTLAVS